MRCPPSLIFCSSKPVEDSTVLPMLSLLQSSGNITTYEHVRGKRPDVIQLPLNEASDVASAEEDVIDFGDNIDFGDGGELDDLLVLFHGLFYFILLLPFCSCFSE